MHEFSIAEEMLKVVQVTLGAPMPVKSVNIILGKLSGVSPDALKFCFSELAQQYGFGAANLEITELLAQARCRQCHSSHSIQDFSVGCPECNSFSREILSGYECIVDSVTLEET